MHDPKTVAFDIRNPLAGRHDNLFTIWHVDPEHGGDDDSCGWSFVTLSKSDYEWVQKTAAQEWKYWFSGKYGCLNLHSAGDLVVVAAVWAEARHHATGQYRCDPLSAWDVSQVFGLLTSCMDNFSHLVRDAKKDGREGLEGFERLLALTLRCYRTARRKPWQHPRWHFWHWQVQCHALQRFCRWAWSRCSGCGGRFSWGYCPVSGWGGAGPRLFRGEKNVFHSQCVNHPRKSK